MSDVRVKDPEATRSFVFDWSARFPDDPLVSAQWEVDGVNLVSTSIEGSQATIRLGGGTEGMWASALCRVTTVSGEVDDWLVWLWVTSDTDAPIPDAPQPETAYEALPPEFQDVVDRTWIRFDDTFDSRVGGPHLDTLPQSRFDRERLATLLPVAMDWLNIAAQPYQSYSIVGPKVFPTEKWGGLLSQVLYIEALRHLRRSYLESPIVQGLGTALLDRTDYWSRWGQVLAEEEQGLQRSLDMYKMAHMGLGRPVVSVDGGVYGQMESRPWRQLHRGRYPWPR